ncbi:hypothetical protein M404DRAFT_1004122, partial [Pisolithus tinctorius Marx 270]
MALGSGTPLLLFALLQAHTFGEESLLIYEEGCNLKVFGNTFILLGSSLGALRFKKIP